MRVQITARSIDTFCITCSHTWLNFAGLACSLACFGATHLPVKPFWLPAPLIGFLPYLALDSKQGEQATPLCQRYRLLSIDAYNQIHSARA